MKRSHLIAKFIIPDLKLHNFFIRLSFYTLNKILCFIHPCVHLVPQLSRCLLIFLPCFLTNLNHTLTFIKNSIFDNQKFLLDAYDLFLQVSYSLFKYLEVNIEAAIAFINLTKLSQNILICIFNLLNNFINLILLL